MRTFIKKKKRENGGMSALDHRYKMSNTCAFMQFTWYDWSFLITKHFILIFNVHRALY